MHGRGERARGQQGLEFIPGTGILFAMVLHQPLHCLLPHLHFSLLHRILKLELMLSDSAVCVMSVGDVHVVKWFNSMYLHCLQACSRMPAVTADNELCPSCVGLGSH